MQTVPRPLSAAPDPGGTPPGQAPSGQAMDRRIAPKNPWPRRGAIAAAVLAAAVAAIALLRPPSGRSAEVDGARLTIAKVQTGQFDDEIQVRGRVTPLHTTFVDTASGGQVEAILVEDGALVERGQLLVELSNTALQLDLISREAQITEQLNDLRGLELSQEQTRLAHEREVVEIEYQEKRLSRKIATAEPLVERGAATQNELDEWKDELGYWRRRHKVEVETRAAADRLQKAQLVKLRAAAEQLERNLGIARKNLESLKVRAPVAGQLSALDLEVGQSLAAGDRIAQIDDPDRYKLLADIDEFYLSRVDLGQPAAYPLGGKTYALKVAKIRPQVQNGQFQVELTFEGEAPDGVRRGQTAQVRLQLGQPTEVLLVPNGAYFNDTGGAWVFVVAPDGGAAVRRKVRLGRRNPQVIEVLDGLSAGEEIVTSAYTSFIDRDRLDLRR